MFALATDLKKSSILQTDISVHSLQDDLHLSFDTKHQENLLNKPH